MVISFTNIIARGIKGKPPVLPSFCISVLLNDFTLPSKCVWEAHSAPVSSGTNEIYHQTSLSIFTVPHLFGFSFWRLWNREITPNFPLIHTSADTHTKSRVSHSPSCCHVTLSGVKWKQLSALTESLLELNQQQETTDHHHTLFICRACNTVYVSLLAWQTLFAYVC